MDINRGQQVHNNTYSCYLLFKISKSTVLIRGYRDPLLIYRVALYRTDIENVTSVRMWFSIGTTFVLSLCVVLSSGFLTNGDTNIADVMKDLTSLRTLLMSTNQKMYSLEQKLNTLEQENVQCKTEIQGLKRNQSQISDHCTKGCSSSKQYNTWQNCHPHPKEKKNRKETIQVLKFDGNFGSYNCLEKKGKL